MRRSFSFTPRPDSTACASTMSTGLRDPGAYCRKLRQRSSLVAAASGRRHKPNGTGLSDRRKNLKPRTKHCRPTGRPMARPAMTSWTKSARCSTTAARRAAAERALGTRKPPQRQRSQRRIARPRGKSCSAALRLSTRRRCKLLTQWRRAICARGTSQAPRYRRCLAEILGAFSGVPNLRLAGPRLRGR